MSLKGYMHTLYLLQGSGGYADINADVYLHAQVESTKERDETGQVYTRQVTLRCFVFDFLQNLCYKRERERETQRERENVMIRISLHGRPVFLLIVKQPQPVGS